ncbi:MAG TPA: PAS domain-containing protein [Chryseosolibacter sp.]|nr:PAS domain-containing protein [Chryseosolibacter sp.]
MSEVEKLKKKNKDLEALERQLRKEVAELRDFVENASLPLHWVNGSGIIIWVNQAELDLLGYSKDEFLNKHISKFHADKDVIEDILRRLMNKETLLNYPARLLCKNGEIKDVLINSNVFWEHGEFVHTRCFTRDVTQLRKVEREKDALIKKLQARVEQLENENRTLRKQKLRS